MCETSQKELQSLAEKHAEKIEEFSALQEQLQVGRVGNSFISHYVISKS